MYYLTWPPAEDGYQPLSELGHDAVLAVEQGPGRGLQL